MMNKKRQQTEKLQELKEGGKKKNRNESMSVYSVNDKNIKTTKLEKESNRKT